MTVSPASTPIRKETSRVSSDNTPAKVFIIGEPSVGKSSLVRQFCDHVFEEDDGLNPTVSQQIKFQEVKLADGKKITLQLWDTVGQRKKFRALPEHTRGVQGVILCFDLSSPASFQTIPRWIKNIAIHISLGTPILLVGTKRDLKAKEIEDDQIRSLTRQLGIKYVETSAKTDFGIDEAFGTLAELIRRKRMMTRKYSGSGTISRSNPYGRLVNALSTSSSLPEVGPGSAPCSMSSFNDSTSASSWFTDSSSSSEEENTHDNNNHTTIGKLNHTKSVDCLGGPDGKLKKQQQRLKKQRRHFQLTPTSERRPESCCIM